MRRPTLQVCGECQAPKVKRDTLVMRQTYGLSGTPSKSLILWEPSLIARCERVNRSGPAALFPGMQHLSGFGAVGSAHAWGA